MTTLTPAEREAAAACAERYPAGQALGLFAGRKIMLFRTAARFLRQHPEAVAYG